MGKPTLSGSSERLSDHIRWIESRKHFTPEERALLISAARIGAQIRAQKRAKPTSGTTLEDRRPTSLYRCFDERGGLLYVGISLTLPQRLAAHSGEGWWADVRRVDVEHHPNRRAARRAERVAIAEESPVHNRAP